MCYFILSEFVWCQCLQAMDVRQVMNAVCQRSGNALYKWPMTVHLSHWVGFWKQESIQKQDVTGCWIIPWGLRDESVNNSPSVFAKQHIKPPTPTCLTSGENHQWEMKLFNHFCLKIPFCWKPIHSSKYWISDLFVQWLTKLAIYFHKTQTGYLNSSIMIDMVTATINENVKTSKVKFFEANRGLWFQI